MNRSMCGDHSLLQALAEGTLSDADLQSVKSHVADCPSCRVAVTEYKQVMWDLAHPLDVELPAELEHSYRLLMREWHNEQKEHQSHALRKSISGSFVPTWANYSVSWTRHLPVNTLSSLVRRTGSTLIGRSLPRWLRRKGGEHH